MYRYRRYPRFFRLILIGSVCAPGIGPAAADIAIVDEIQITSTPGYVYTTPTLSEDDFTDYVAYVAREQTSTGLGGGRVYYQRFDATGLLGDPVLIRSLLSPSEANDQLPTANGDFVIYSRFADTLTSLGYVLLYEIPTGVTTQLSSLNDIQDASMGGSTIAWVEGQRGATRVLTIPLTLIHKNVLPTVIAGPTPPATDVEVGQNVFEQLIVWQQHSDGQWDVMAHDRRTGENVVISADSAIDEKSPDTSGSWVVWEQNVGSGATTIEALDVDTGERRTIVSDGSLNSQPSIDGDYIAWESDSAGNFDIYLHRLSTGETFQITNRLDDQQLNTVHENNVAYADSRDGFPNVYVATVEFATPPPLVCTEPTAGLAGCYRFEGDAVDESGNGQNGTLRGDPEFTSDADGQPEGALSLDGVDDRVFLPRAPFSLDEFTIAAMVSTPEPDSVEPRCTLGSCPTLVSKGRGFGNYTIEFPYSGGLSYAHETARGVFSTQLSAEVVPAGEFFGLAVTSGNGRLRVYING